MSTISDKLENQTDLRDDVVYILKEALTALNTVPNFRTGATTSYDIASQIERLLHRLRSPASYQQRQKGGAS